MVYPHQRFLDWILTPFAPRSPVVPLVLLSLMTAFLILIAFRFTSDQRRIRQTKNAIKAHLLEVWLFRDNLRLVLSAQWQILKLNGRYLGLTTRPVLVMMIPLSLILISLDGWFGYRPMRPGEQTIVSLVVSDGRRDLLEGATLETNGGLAVETPALRIPLAGEVDWRIRALRPGIHRVSVNLAGRLLEKELVVSQNLVRISPSRVRSGFSQGLLYAAEPPIPDEWGIDLLSVEYPSRSIEVFSWRLHWLVCFFALSCIFAFAFKRLLRVEL